MSFFKKWDIARPQWFPDGHTLLFQKDKVRSIPKGQFLSLAVPDIDIYKLNINTRKITPLANSELNEEGYNISPDGSKIVYLKDDSAWLMDSQGNNKQNLKISVDYDYIWGNTFSWSPDSSKFVCKSVQSKAQNLYKLFIYDLTTKKSDIISNQTSLTTLQAPIWSPSGNYIIMYLSAPLL